MSRLVPGANAPWINEQHLKLCRIPSATFFEQKRGEWMAEQFRALGWEAKVDRGGNTIAYGKASGDAPHVAVTARISIRFSRRVPAEDIKVRRRTLHRARSRR